MADFVFNIAKGRVAELMRRVANNDPANSAIIIVPIDAGAVTDATLKDLTTLSAVVGAVTERSSSGWARKTLTDSVISVPAPDNTNDWLLATLPNQTWSSVSAGAVTDLVICYDDDTTGGTDANIIPLAQCDFAITPDGTSVVADLTTNGFYKAS
jgi:hypothetical protein